MDEVTQKKIFDSRTTSLVASNDKLRDIMKIVKSQLDAGVMTKRVTKTLENET